MKCKLFEKMASYILNEFSDQTYALQDFSFYERVIIFKSQVTSQVLIQNYNNASKLTPGYYSLHSGFSLQFFPSCLNFCVVILHCLTWACQKQTLL